MKYRIFNYDEQTKQLVDNPNFTQPFQNCKRKAQNFIWILTTKLYIHLRMKNKGKVLII